MYQLMSCNLHDHPTRAERLNLRTSFTNVIGSTELRGEWELYLADSQSLQKLRNAT